MFVFYLQAVWRLQVKGRGQINYFTTNLWNRTHLSLKDYLTISDHLVLIKIYIECFAEWSSVYVCLCLSVCVSVCVFHCLVVVVHQDVPINEVLLVPVSVPRLV